VLSTDGLVDTLERVHCSNLTMEEFADRFERPKIPVIVTGLCDGWQAGKDWSEENLLRRFEQHRFKVQGYLHKRAIRLGTQ
jgi:histone arginine demethylase JMJD6